jgi:hypothetical protein
MFLYFSGDIFGHQLKLVDSDYYSISYKHNKIKIRHGIYWLIADFAIKFLSFLTKNKKFVGNSVKTIYEKTFILFWQAGGKTIFLSLCSKSN